MLKQLRSFGLVILECLESLGLIVSIILAIPTNILRRLDRLYAALFYVKFMVPRSLLAPSLRVYLDYKTGNYLRAANLLEQIALKVETENAAATSIKVSRMLCDIYCLLFRLQILSGNVEEAAIVVIRAQETLGMDRLPTTSGFDVKVAHVVKAGIAAGKLLDDGGLATLLVRQGQEPEVQKSLDDRRKTSKTSKFRSSRRTDKADRAAKSEAEKTTGKLIPFPSKL